MVFLIIHMEIALFIESKSSSLYIWKAISIRENQQRQFLGIKGIY